ncbi:Uncharacterized protein TCM_022103 [Theobroma cacao]|uniref:Uncharacterized protein n=1 Tax=Theobroma cacao TaxID=3641 RepID=A0A061EZU7_THECC|nr:Uncharacterized protein TCM_022103 [Theobroma cacao]
MVQNLLQLPSSCIQVLQMSIHLHKIQVFQQFILFHNLLSPFGNFLQPHHHVFKFFNCQYSFTDSSTVNIPSSNNSRSSTVDPISQSSFFNWTTPVAFLFLISQSTQSVRKRYEIHVIN